MRPKLDVNRSELRSDVQRRALGLISSGTEDLAAHRIAIETALTERQLLTVNNGGPR